MADVNLTAVATFVDKASPDLKKFEASLAGVGNSFKAFAAGFAGAAAGALSLNFFAQATKAAIDAADQIGKAAQQVGVSIESLSALKFAASLSDVNFDELKMGLQQLAKSFDEAEDPMSKAATAFEILGVNVKDATGKIRPTEAVLSDIANAFKNAKDGPEKTAIAMELFGKSGAKLIPMLNAGAEGLEKFKEEARALGVVFADDTSKAAEEFNDTITRITTVISGQFIKVAEALLPMLQSLASQFLEMAKNGGQFQTFLSGMTAVIKTFTGIAYIAVRTINQLAKGVGALIAAAVAAASGDLSLAADILKEYAADTKQAYNETIDFTSALIDNTFSANQNTTATDDNTKKVLANMVARQKAKKEAADLQKEFERAVQDLQKEDKATKDLSLSERILLETQSGRFAKFTQAQKDVLIAKAKEIELTNKLYEAEKVRSDTQASNLQNLQQQASDAVRASNATATYYETLRTKGLAAADSEKRFGEAFDQVTKTIRDKQAERDIVAQQAAEGDENARRKLAKLDAELKGLQADYTAVATAISDAKGAQEGFNVEIDAVKKAADRDQAYGILVRQLQALDAAYKAGTISAEAYFNQSVEFAEAYKRTLTNIEPQLTQLDEFVKKAAHSMQESMSDFFFDAMQGKLTDFVGGFKRAIDRIVADMLAAQVAMFLFGDYGRTGSLSGGALASLGSFVGSLFQEEGGPLNKGQPYIVGEKRPEVFVPKTSGYLFPSEGDYAKSMGTGGSNVVNLNITAMDSQDVIRSIEKVKRPLYQMLQGTGRTYNMGAA